MKSLNTVQLIGWLGDDPEFIKRKDGSLLARMRLATDVYLPQQAGEPKKYVTWHTVKVWRQKQIESLRNYLTKGSHILVDGRIEYRRYIDKQGVSRTATEIIANYLIDLDR
jgi:single-strand DNA-binding protein